MGPPPTTSWRHAAALLAEWATPGLRPVLNLTGVVIHTNLGRAPLSEAAIEQSGAGRPLLQQSGV